MTNNRVLKRILKISPSYVRSGTTIELTWGETAATQAKRKQAT